MKSVVVVLAAALAGSALPLSAAAQSFSVDAYTHSTSNPSYLAGAGLNTGLIFSLNDALTITTDINDTWNIGTDYANVQENAAGGYYGYGTIGTLTAPFGSLIGRIGAGEYFQIGVSPNGIANASGTLHLFTFDTDFYNNVGSILATVTYSPATVPLPAAGLLLIGALGALGMSKRRKTL